MKAMGLSAAALLALFVVGVTIAVSPATVTWVPPTQYSDGSAIASGDLDHYTVTWVGNPGPSGSVNVPAGASLPTVAVPVACGQANFSVSVTTGAKAKYPNATSTSTGPVLFDSKVSCTPNPPSGLAVH